MSEQQGNIHVDVIADKISIQITSMNGAKSDTLLIDPHMATKLGVWFINEAWKLEHPVEVSDGPTL